MKLKWVLSILLALVPLRVFALKDSYSSLWPADSSGFNAEFRRRIGVCEILLKQLENLEPKSSDDFAPVNSRWIEISTAFTRWTGSFEAVKDWYKISVSLAQEKATYLESWNAFLNFAQAAGLASRPLEIQETLDYLKDPARFQSRGSFSPTAQPLGPIMLKDGEHLDPYRWHSIIGPFAKNDFKQVDQLSRRWVQVSNTPELRAELGQLLLASIRDLRSGVGRAAKFYNSYESTRAAIMIARTWKRLGSEGENFLMKSLDSPHSEARGYALETLNLLEAVFPLQSQWALSRVLDIAANDNSFTNQYLAGLHLLKVHRSWIKVYALTNLSDLEKNLVHRPHPLLPYRQHISNLVKANSEQFEELSAVDEENRDSFSLGLFGGYRILSRFLDRIADNSFDARTRNFDFPESQAGEDMDENGYTIEFGYFKFLATSNLDYDMQCLRTFNRDYYGALN